MAWRLDEDTVDTLTHAELRRVDAEGRISLGHESLDRLYAIQRQPNGDILLSPVVVRHEREAWLYDNPAALDSIRRGLEESARGETHSLGDFGRYLDDDDE